MARIPSQEGQQSGDPHGGVASATSPRKDKKADYILALKGNQGTLREDVELFAAEQKATGFKDTKITRHETVDGDHGRIETRTYTVIHDVAWLQQRHQWPGLQGVLMVESQREIPGPSPQADTIERETRFYICASPSNSGPAIRAHWGREYIAGLGSAAAWPLTAGAQQALPDATEEARPSADLAGEQRGFCGQTQVSGVGDFLVPLRKRCCRSQWLCR